MTAAGAALVSLLGTYLWTTFGLLRQHGRLLLRVDALEARIGIAGPELPGLPENTPAPAFSLRELDGATVTFDSLTKRGKPLVLIFGEPGCGACEELFPDVARWQQQHEERLTIVLISHGKLAANRDQRDRNKLRNVLVQADREVAEAYRVVGTPSAVLVRDGRIATPLSEGADQVRSLIVRANLPPPVKKGEPVPSLELVDLDGQALDLSTLRGRNRALVFWDPADCSCQQMIPDIKTQELSGLAKAPELILIASGPAESTRAHAFRSRVLLDPHLAGRALFGAVNLPAVVVIDEHGRMATDVKAGYVPSFELIGLVPFVPTANETVEAMLKLASVKSTDVVYDLGCGDGRVVVGAAKTYGARAVGVDINPQRLDEGRANAKAAAVEHLVRFEQGDLSDVDVHEATVVTMYLLPKVNMQLRGKLLAELKAGTRVVSHGFDMEDWKPEREIVVNGDTLYLWTIPEKSRRP